MIEASRSTHGEGRCASQHRHGLAAAAAAEAMGVSIDIHRALSTFGSTSLDNPGRCQAVEIDGVRLFLDFDIIHMALRPS